MEIRANINILAVWTEMLEKVNLNVLKLFSHESRRIYVKNIRNP